MQYLLFTSRGRRVRFKASSLSEAQKLAEELVVQGERVENVIWEKKP